MQHDPKLDASPRVVTSLTLEFAQVLAQLYSRVEFRFRRGIIRGM